jgi:pyruvate/2-oxoglutarate dehydrogenase complex dihydrolipoamide dehydrogenase (E3) component
MSQFYRRMGSRVMVIEGANQVVGLKVIIDAKTNRILGAAVLASEGAELVHLYVDVMNADAPYTIIRDAIHIHPTLARQIKAP